MWWPQLVKLARADEEEEDFGFAEEWAYVPQEVLEGLYVDLDEVLGDEQEAVPEAGEPAGEPFPEDDTSWFVARLPRLSARYGAPGGEPS